MIGGMVILEQNLEAAERMRLAPVVELALALGRQCAERRVSLAWVAGIVLAGWRAAQDVKGQA